MIRLIGTAALILIAGNAHQVLCQQPAPSGEILTLEQAINITLRNNRSAQNARFEVDKADDKTAALRTRRLPAFKLSTLFSKPLSTFETTFEKGIFGTFEGIGPIPAEDTSVASQTNATALVIAQILSL